jgi:hypothetical protein
MEPGVARGFRIKHAESVIAEIGRGNSNPHRADLRTRSPGRRFRRSTALLACKNKE